MEDTALDLGDLERLGERLDFLIVEEAAVGGDERRGDRLDRRLPGDGERCWRRGERELHTFDGGDRLERRRTGERLRRGERERDRLEPRSRLRDRARSRLVDEDDGFTSGDRREDLLPPLRSGLELAATRF